MNISIYTYTCTYVYCTYVHVYTQYLYICKYMCVFVCVYHSLYDKTEYMRPGLT